MSISFPPKIDLSFSTILVPTGNKLLREANRSFSSLETPFSLFFSEIVVGPRLGKGFVVKVIPLRFPMENIVESWALIRSITSFIARITRVGAWGLLNSR